MLLFFTSVLLLLGGYFVYSRIVEGVFGIDESRTTPAIAKEDGVDFVPLGKKKIYLVQLLNIAGVGPIFGPILGALYGPAALLWIVIGCIFAGAVHDYFSGMLSIRNDGASVPAMSGKYLGAPAKHLMNVFAVVLLLLVGVVFVSAPAKMITNLANDTLGIGIGMSVVVVAIFAYYLFATIVPIDKIIAKFYPYFGALLIFMSVGLMSAVMLSSDHQILGGFGASDMFFNLNPKGAPLWPALFITIACGAISGFHATQSPMMARCITNENEGRFVFYGAMIGEGIIAIIWCTLALSFYGDLDGLGAAIAAGGPGKVVYDASFGLLGTIGGVLAFLGVVILPITSGDTAFRSTRLILSEYFGVAQKEVKNRLFIALPVFVIGAVLTQVDFGVIWRYFGFANQLLASTMLWTAAGYLVMNGKNHLICSIPALFMTTVAMTFIINSSKLGLGLGMGISTVFGVMIAAACFYYVSVVRKRA